MPNIRLLSDGELYICSSRRSKSKSQRIRDKSWKSVFIIRSVGTSGSLGDLSTGGKIYLPKEYIGKRVMLRVEVLDAETKKKM